MKAIKYVMTGVLAMGLSASALAQDVDYKTAIKPIIAAFDAAPNDPNAAKDLIKQYKKEYKKDVQALVALGNAYVQHHDLDAAEALANELTLNKKANVSDAYVLLGDVAVIRDSIGNAGPAASQYATAISLDAKNKKAYERYATVYRHIDLNLAISKLEEYKAIDPSYQVETEIARLCYGEGQYQMALDWYKKGNAAAYSVGEYQKYALSAYQVKKDDECFEIAKQGLAKYPGDANLLRFALWGAVDGTHKAEAINYANDLFKTDAEKAARDYEYLGYAQIEAKDYNNAITNLNKAYELNSENTKPLSKVSVAYRELGQEDLALEYSQKYLDATKSPSLSDFVNLADIYVQKGDKATGAEATGFYDKAIGVYENLAVKAPGASDIAYYYASTVCAKKADDAQARSYYEKIVKFDEGKTVSGGSAQVLEVALTQLMSYENSNQNFAKAKEYAKQILAVNPNNSNAKVMLEFDENAASAE